MVSQLRARVQPQIQYLLQARAIELGSTCVHESDDRNVLLAKRPQQLVRHCPHACQIARASVAAARQIYFLEFPINGFVRRIKLR